MFKMEKMLESILNECRGYTQQGEVASYIPELAKADRNEFAICVVSGDGQIHSAGDFNKSFTMQSVVKPIILLAALMYKGADRVRNLVGAEATGKPFDAFNYSDRALRREHINPMINTGAIALCTLLCGKDYREKFENLLDLTRKMAGNERLEIDEQVYLSEKATGNKNRALAYMLKAYSMIDDDIEEVLDCYFRACSINVTVKELSRIAFVLANSGIEPKSQQRLFKKEYATYTNAVLMTCGMYDGSGEFAINVGIPAKSGVGGGIMAVVPDKMGIGIYSPALDKKGNSVAGIKALEMLSKRLKLSIF